MTSLNMESILHFTGQDCITDWSAADCFCRLAILIITISNHPYSFVMHDQRSTRCASACKTNTT